MTTRLTRRHALGLAALATGLPSPPPSGPPWQQARRWRSRATTRSPISPTAPTPGSPDIEYVWDEHRYQFASGAHRDMFKADPVHYAPQFGNFCAMALAKGLLVVADPDNWLISDGKLYVFGKPAPAGPVLFQKDLAANITKANQNRSMLPPKP